MTEHEVYQLLEKAQALIRDSHIVYTSGRHGTSYVNKDAVYPHAALTSILCEEMAARFAAQEVEVVVAPALGGVILSQWVAYHLSHRSGKEVLGVYAEKEGEGFVLKRGYDRLVAGRRALLLEDVLTTGGSIRKLVDTVRAAGGEIVGVAALCNRGGVTASALGEVPRLDALVSVSLDSWEEKDCPLCASGVPINADVGKGREFLKKKPG